MSNFICPTCGFYNIDCGKAGYKTAREIELEKKLDIAVKALESAFGGFKTIQHMAAYPITHFSHPKGFDCLFSGAVDKCAEIKEALANIKEKKIDNKIVFSDKKPKNGSYILGNQNHVGWYLNGYVYYWAFDCRKGYPRRAKLKDWCDAWLYLKPCCLASEEEYRETMGDVKPFEPCEYEEFNVID